MENSEIFIKPIISTPFQENAYITYLQANPNKSASAQPKNKECFVVDPGFEPELIIDYLRSSGLDLAAILVTHGHLDHIAGVSELRKAYPNCKVYIGKLDADKLTDAELNLSSQFGKPITTTPADVMLEHGDNLNIAGIEIEVLHVPGHSRGHVVYLIRSTPTFIVFGGDLIFRGGVGRTDFPDGNHSDLFKSIKSKILTLPPDTIIFTGHGANTTVRNESR
ncbi:MAG: MBL fold metallo-hydrolase [Planctomycetaceae bacterium]|jgi:glyoxylase-like metal-dependent hydrolase (beta-lactamase superfamily II)|nr:MBL fold metallo-hydrolase [Planctomycetaceae bacterium]